MSKLSENNRKFINTKQRWETLTGKTCNKENTINNAVTVTKTIKKCPPAIILDKKKPLPPQRTITKYFKLSNIKKYNNLELQDSKGNKFEFSCFDDKVLNIPPSFNQTITHSMDNDCQSDNEQVESAVRQLTNFLQCTITIYKQQSQQ